MKITMTMKDARRRFRQIERTMSFRQWVRSCAGTWEVMGRILVGKLARIAYKK